MKTFKSLRLVAFPVVVIGWVGMASCSSSSIPTATELTTVSVRATASGGVHDQVMAGINDFRRSEGKAAFHRDRDLDNLAQHHAEHMLKAKKLSHDGYHLRLGAAESYFGIGMLRENVYWSLGRPKAELPGAIVNGWVNSPGHRRNLLAHTKECGIGVASDAEGNVYAVQLSGIRINRSGGF